MRTIRKSTMRLIDADELKGQLERIFKEAYEWKNKTALAGDHSRYERADGAVAAYIEAIMTVNKAPTVDAVPVVRCKDCKWFRDVDDYCICISDESPKGLFVKSNDFCNRGIRAEVDD